MSGLELLLPWGKYVEPAVPKRCARVGCSNKFLPQGRGKTQKRYCSNKCRRALKAVRRGLKTLPRGPQRKLEKFRCGKGHERTAETTFKKRDGSITCLICKRESERKLHAAKTPGYQPRLYQRKAA